MNADYLATIEQSMKSIFGGMAGIELTLGEFHIKDNDKVAVGDSVSSVISLNGADQHFFHRL